MLKDLLGYFTAKDIEEVHNATLENEIHQLHQRLQDILNMKGREEISEKPNLLDRIIFGEGINSHLAYNFNVLLRDKTGAEVPVSVKLYSDWRRLPENEKINIDDDSIFTVEFSPENNNLQTFGQLYFTILNGYRGWAGTLQRNNENAIDFDLNDCTRLNQLLDLA